MADSDIEIKAGFVETDLEDRKLTMIDDLNNPLAIVERVYLIWWHWADFHLHVISPHIDTITPAIIIEPEPIPGSNDREFVYPIHDSGSKLSTSKSQDMFSAGMSMCKLFYTIEKMVHILVDRLKSGGVSMETEVQIAFAGHEIAQRKAFESIINLPYNVVVTNFDPGIWGEKYLQNVKRMADKGYGYPPESPRENYKHPVSPATTARK
ncbi:TPA: virulence factor [Legionella pneumophila]|nr:virulence factor [Legionella pneumophila]HAT8181794.1 virulence factor [Legionella pneumophila]